MQNLKKKKNNILTFIFMDYVQVTLSVTLSNIIPLNIF